MTHFFVSMGTILNDTFFCFHFGHNLATNFINYTKFVYQFIVNIVDV